MYIKACEHVKKKIKTICALSLKYKILNTELNCIIHNLYEVDQLMFTLQNIDALSPVSKLGLNSVSTERE
jgi:hypothetical protein